jgi:hypothetical protein
MGSGLVPKTEGIAKVACLGEFSDVVFRVIPSRVVVIARSQAVC